MPRITENDLTPGQKLALTQLHHELHVAANVDRKEVEPEETTDFVIDADGFFRSAVDGRTFVFPYDPHCPFNPAGEWIELRDDGSTADLYDADAFLVDDLIASEGQLSHNP